MCHGDRRSCDWPDTVADGKTRARVRQCRIDKLLWRAGHGIGAESWNDPIRHGLDSSGLQRFEAVEPSDDVEHVARMGHVHGLCVNHEVTDFELMDLLAQVQLT